MKTQLYHSSKKHYKRYTLINVFFKQKLTSQKLAPEIDTSQPSALTAVFTSILMTLGQLNKSQYRGSSSIRMMRGIIFLLIIS